MKAWQLTESELVDIVADVNAHYGGNIRLENVRTEGKRVRTVNFTLRTVDCRGAGSRRGMRYDGTLGKRTTSACWHVHRDVLRAVFALHPDARVRTMLADYRGADDFERTYVGTSEMQCWQGGPARDRGDECECHGVRVASRVAEPRLASSDSLSADAHRVYALADAEIAQWNEFLASLQSKKRQSGRTTQ